MNTNPISRKSVTDKDYAKRLWCIKYDYVSDDYEEGYNG